MRLREVKSLAYGHIVLRYGDKGQSQLFLTPDFLIPGLNLHYQVFAEFLFEHYWEQKIHHFLNQPNPSWAGYKFSLYPTGILSFQLPPLTSTPHFLKHNYVLNCQPNTSWFLCAWIQSKCYGSLRHDLCPLSRLLVKWDQNIQSNYRTKWNHKKLG